MSRLDPTLPLVLVGLPGVGKSAVGRRVAERLARPFVDTDDVVVERDGRPIPTIFLTDGEAAFRRRETEALEQALAAAGPPVVATGGGIVVTDANRRLLAERAVVVWLDARPEALADRVGDGVGRPMLDGAAPADRLVALDRERRARYGEVADRTVDAERPVDEVVTSVLALLGHPAASAAPEVGS